MKQFWKMVDQGTIQVINMQACQDAWADTPDMLLEDFLDEAEEYGWIAEIAE